MREVVVPAAPLGAALDLVTLRCDQYAGWNRKAFTTVPSRTFSS